MVVLYTLQRKRLTRSAPTTDRVARMPLPNTAQHFALYLLWGSVFYLVPNANAQDTGVRIGSFTLSPQVDIRETYSDNVFFDNQNDETEDLITVVGSELRLESDWSRHALALSARVDIGRFAKNSDENTEEYGAKAVARLDLLRGATLVLNGEYDRIAERRDNAENETRITEINQFGSTATLNYRPNRLGLRLRGDVLRRDFRDSQEERRNRNDYGLATRLSYETTPDFAIFAEPFVTIRDFDNLQQDGSDQDSLVYGSLLGVEVDLGATLTGEFGAGVFREEFDRDDRDDFSGLAIDGAVTWRPTRLSRITGDVSRRPQPTQVGGATSKVRTQARLSIRQDIRRDIALAVLGDYFREDFEGIARVDDTYRGSFDVNYDVRDRISIFSGYEYRQRVSDDSSRDYRSHAVTIGLRARF